MIGRRQLLGLLGGSGLLAVPKTAAGQPRAARPFNGLTMGVGDLYRLSHAKTRSISPENFTGEKGKGGMATEGTGAQAARDLGAGLEDLAVGPHRAEQTFTLADITGPGAIQHIWMTPTGHWRYSILRIYWDGETTPSVECRSATSSRRGWGKYAQINSLAVAVNPGSAFNCYWAMPFRKRCRITLENIADEAHDALLPDRLHADRRARRRRVLPRAVPAHQPAALQAGSTPSSTACKGEGHYVGTHWRGA